jgi:hypothetical protein
MIQVGQVKDGFLAVALFALSAHTSGLPAAGMLLRDRLLYAQLAGCWSWVSAQAISRKSRRALAPSRWQNIHLKMEMEISLRCDDGLSTSR